MTELFEAKYDELLTEFHRYLSEHPRFLARIPDEALVILLDRRDRDFCRFALRRARAYRTKDDKPNRPVVYVDVGELAPAHSRLIRPRILRKTPEFVGV